MTQTEFWMGKNGEYISCITLTENIKVLAPELFFFNFSTPCIWNVNYAGTQYIRIMKQTAFWTGKNGDYTPCLKLTENIKPLGPECFFCNFRTPCIWNVNYTGTKYVRIMKQTTFSRGKNGEYILCLKLTENINLLAPELFFFNFSALGI